MQLWVESPFTEFMVMLLLVVDITLTIYDATASSRCYVVSLLIVCSSTLPRVPCWWACCWASCCWTSLSDSGPVPQV